MFSRKGLALVTACAAMACGSLVRADIAPASATNLAANFQPMMLDDTGAPTKMPQAPDIAPAPAATQAAPAASAPSTPPSGGSLMGALRTIKIGNALDDWGVVVTGYAEGSVTYNAHPIPGNIMSDRVFDTKASSLIFDGVELNITKAADYTSKTVTFGFTLEQMYGWDAAYFHSNGLGIYSSGKTAGAQIPGAGSTASIHPKAQYDLTQANFVVTAPIWHGIGFEGGKFDTLLGYEVLDGPSNPFYSHSFIFDEEPFTHTGALLSAYLTDPTSADRVEVQGGITRGWDQATEDNNGSIDYTGSIAYTKVDTAQASTPTLYSIALNAITGDEQVSGVQDGWRTVLDVVGHYALSDQASLGLNAMYGWQAQAANGGFGGGNGQWYGAAVYAQYAPTSVPQIIFNIRAEWFDDQDGAAPTQLSAGGFGIGGAPNTPNQFYEGTVGLTIKPFIAGLAGAPNLGSVLAGLAIRPELRWDYADHGAFNGGTQHDQFTAALEAYFSF